MSDEITIARRSGGGLRRQAVECPAGYGAGQPTEEIELN
jgi:hypothetical protein